MGSLFSPGKAQTSSSTQVNLPGWSTSGLGAVGERATSLMDDPYRSYTGQRVAGMSDWTQQAAGTAQEVSGYQPGQVAPGSVSAERVQPWMVDSPGQVAPGSVRSRDVRPQSLAGTNLSPYFDPYQEQVIDAAMADVDRSTRVAQAGRTAGGIQAAGFGGFGDRASVAGAEIERAGIDAKARTAAGLRSSGFQRSQDMAVGDISRGQAAQEGNANRALQAGTTNLQAGQRAGEFNVSTEMQRQLANQQAGTRAGEFNATTGLQAATTNLQAGQRAQEFNVSSGLQGAAQRLQGSQQLAALGEAERGIRQAGADFDYQQFRESRDDPYLKTQWGAGLLTGASAPFQGNTTSQGTQPGPTIAGQIGGLATAAVGAAALMSDPKEKTDRKRLGTDPETGLGLWSFRYKGDPKTYPKVVGYMADEVEDRFPQAVRRVAGRRTIDPDALARAGGEYADGGMADPLEPFRRRDRRAIDERWDRNPAQPMRPIIEGVAEAIPSTGAWEGTPAVPNMVPRPVALPGGGAVPDEAYDSGYYPFTGGAPGPVFGGEQAGWMPEGRAAGAEDESRFGQAGPVAAALQRIAAARRGGRDDERRFGQVGPMPPPRDAGPDAMPADGPLVPVSTSGGAGGGGGAAAVPEEDGFFRRLGRRLTDPDYAGPLALIHAGAGMMASRHPYALGALGEGLSRGVQTARELMPEARQKRESGELATLVQGLGLPADAVSPRVAPRSAPGGGGGGPTRMTSVAVPGGSLRQRAAMAESGGNPNERNPAQGSTSTGVLGITDAMWSDYAPRLRLPASARNDPEAQGAVFDAFEQDMRRQLPGVLGRDATDADVYAAWGLGPAGFRALATAAPDADAFEVYAGVAGPQRAAQAFSQNGALMRRGMTASQVVDAWGRRVSGGGGGAAPGGGDDRRPGPAARPAPEPEPEPTVPILGRNLTRGQVLSIMSAAPNNPAVQRVMGNALQVLNGDIARQEAQRDRREARAESAELRLQIANRDRAPTPSPLSRLIAERDALPPNDPRRASYDAAIRSATGEGRAEGWTAVQIAQSRQQATSQARQEANALDFDTEADRSGWIMQRGRELLGEWGVPERPEGAGGAGGASLPLSGGAGGQRPSGVPEDAAPEGPRIRPRGPVRALSDNARRELGRTGEAAVVLPALVRDFRDDFGGFMSETVGDFSNWLARRTPGESPRADWWARYQEQTNLIRNALFGSALTRTEKEQFDRQSINPGMSAEAIRSRLAEQSATAQRAAQKLAASYATGGYNRREIEAALGFALPQEPAPAPGAGAASGPNRSPPPGGAPRAAPAPAPAANPLERFLPQGAQQ
jgi:hypothetical protein